MVKGDILKKDSGVYIIINKINSKYYIGSTCNFYSRFYGHQYQIKQKIKHSKFFLDDIFNFGEENFIFLILEKCNEQIVKEREEYYIHILDSTNPEKGYNIEAYPTNGGKMSIQSRNKIREKAKNRVLSEETRLKISKTKKARKSHVKERNSMWGKTHSLDIILKYSKPIIQFDLYGNFVTGYQSGRDAARKLGFPVHRGPEIGFAANHKRVFKGFRWGRF